MSRSAGTWSTTAHHSRLKYSPAAGRIFQLPSSSRPRSSNGSDSSQRRYSGLTCNSAGLSKTLAGIKVTLIGRSGSAPGNKILPICHLVHQLLRSIGPHGLFRGANEIAQNAGTLRDRKPGLLVDPPG